jgi:double-strand break repair protein MRE11
MVLIAGDLFHDNRPTRHTLYKTMDILRRYCLGQNPVKVRILSDPAHTFRSGTLNYLEENISIDLPVLSIHGNHDDPTRDVSGETLAALDLLSVASLVNYFGRQERIDEVEVCPVLVQKGLRTKVALYGLGSMRDERLNRMWNQGKVKFLKPEEDGGGVGGSFFNIFALHQNRDVGRGSKNAIREDMLPEWLDLVVWGHEHECQIEFAESVTGTFRISQPGSSVATSLVAGEAVRKKVGLLDVRQDEDGMSHFRLSPIPLTQVRGFVTTELCLRDHRARLDPEDPKVDSKITAVLEDEVRLLLLNARDSVKDMQESARRAGSDAGDDSSPLKYRLQKPSEVLVRIKVDHSGFSTLNNQRFGSRFVGEVANPGDVLLFSRRKEVGKSGGTTGGGAGRRAVSSLLRGLGGPVPPDEPDGPATVEDLVMGHLEAPERKLQLLDKVALNEAVVEFTEKHTVSAIPDAAVKMIKKKQKELIRRGKDGEEVIEKGSHVREILDAESQLVDEKRRVSDQRAKRSREEDERYDSGGMGKWQGKENIPHDDDDDDDDDNNKNNEDDPAVHGRASDNRSSKTSSRGVERAGADNPQRKAARRQQLADESDEDDDAMEVEEIAPTPSKARSRAAATTSASLSGRPKRTQTVKRPNHAVDDGDDSDAYVDRRGDSEDGEMDEEVGFDEDAPTNKRAPKTSAAASGRGRKSAGLTKKAPAASRPRTTSGTIKPRKGSVVASHYSSRFNDSSDDDNQNCGHRSRAADEDMDDDWGTAATRSQF